MENEVWKPIEGYEGLYDLRSDGLLYSYPRKTTKGGYTYGNNGHSGYKQITLSKNNKRVTIRMNRLVWIVFVGAIPEGYDVHHINNNRADNRLSNLELIEHIKHTKKHNPKNTEEKSKSVVQYTIDGKFVAEYPSISEAERQTGIDNSHISSCCSQRTIKKKHKDNIYNYTVKTAGGYVWKYKEVA